MKIIVTGARGALGKTLVSLLEAQGHTVVGIDRPIDGEPGKPRSRMIDCDDLADRVSAAKAIEAAVARMAGLDAVVLLAGGFAWSRVADSDAQLWRNLFRDNVETGLAVVQAVLPLLRQDGAILTIGAASADPAGPGMAPYAAAKSAVARLTEALSEECQSTGVRINCLLPRIMDTPANRAAMPDTDPLAWTSCEAVAEVAAFLISPAARAINGAMIPVTRATR